MRWRVTKPAAHPTGLATQLPYTPIANPDNAPHDVSESNCPAEFVTFVHRCTGWPGSGRGTWLNQHSPIVEDFRDCHH